MKKATPKSSDVALCFKLEAKFNVSSDDKKPLPQLL